MLRKLAVALIAASVSAAPVLAQTGATGSQTPATKPAVTAPVLPAKATPTKPAKNIKKNRHTGKQVRHSRHGAVAKVHGKARTSVKTSGLKGANQVAHKGGPTATVR